MLFWKSAQKIYWYFAYIADFLIVFKVLGMGTITRVKGGEVSWAGSSKYPRPSLAKSHLIPSATP